jgi:hypothetical protein
VTTRDDDDPELSLLTAKEAAALLRVSPRWLQRSHAPRIRAGGTVRYDRDAVLAWFRAQEKARGKP